MTDDKDRFGDKLREKGKGDEEAYFAAREREKLEALRKTGEGEAPRGLCPRCGVKLEEQELHGVSIDVCKDCGGIWLDKGELEQLQAREEEGWFTTWVRDVLEGPE